MVVEDCKLALICKRFYIIDETSLVHMSNVSFWQKESGATYMKYKWGKGLLVCSAIVITACFGLGFSQQKEQKITADTTSNEGYQLSQTYPLSEKDADFDSSLVTNQIRKFTSYRGQGSLLVKTNDPRAFKMYVNGDKITTRIAGNNWQNIDISRFTRNGSNDLQVSQINDNSQAKMEVKVPYPVLKDKSRSYSYNDNFRLIDQLINSEIKHGFTSAQLVVTKNGNIIKSSAYGRVNSYDQQGKRLKNTAKVTPNTLYDMASNTKMYATNYAVQKLVADGKLNIDQKVNEFFPDFKDGKDDQIKGKNDLTVKEILQHQAGFPADPQYHNRNYDPNDPDKPKPNANEKLYTQDRNKVMSKIIATPLEYKPGTKTMYSDVDYMLLGFIVEKITGQRLDKYMSETYYQPLNLQHTTFQPLEHGFAKNQVAATELNGNTRDGAIDFDNIRKNTIQGEVHDEKAYYAMGGVSGHAGLFANARDLAVLTQITMNKGGYGDQAFFDEDTNDQFVKPKDTNSSYGLGWRREGHLLYSWAFSPLSDSSTVGHTGWTGTLTVIDPVNHMSVVLLTNTKNSKVVDNKKDPNDFYGNHFLTGQYGMVSTLAFDSDKKNNSEANDSKLIDMVNSKYSYMKANEKDQVKADYDQLSSMLDVIKERRGHYEMRQYAHSKQFNKIQKFVADK